MAPAKKGGKKEGHSAISEVVTREYTINIHKHIHGVGFKKFSLCALKEIWKFAMKEMGTQDMCIDTRLNEAVWSKGIRNATYRILFWSGCPENIMRMMIHQTSSLCWSSMYLLPLSKIYKQLMWLRTNCWLFNKVITLPKKCVFLKTTGYLFYFFIF